MSGSPSRSVSICDLVSAVDSAALAAATQRPTPLPTTLVPTVSPSTPSPTLAQTRWPSFTPSLLPSPFPTDVPSPSPSWPWLELRSGNGALLGAVNGEVTLTPTSQQDKVVYIYLETPIESLDKAEVQALKVELMELTTLNPLEYDIVFEVYSGSSVIRVTIRSRNVVHEKWRKEFLDL